MTKKSRSHKKTQAVSAKPEIKEAVAKQPIKADKVSITAKRDTELPNGVFVPKGTSVEVSTSFVERLKEEKDDTFII